MTETARETVLDIEGMTCASCVQRVERALQQVELVRDASVNLATRQATVHDSGADAQDLIRAVQGVGYTARLHGLDEIRDTDKEARAWYSRLVVAAPLTIGVLIASFGFPDAQWATWVAWALATPVQFWAGWPFLLAAARSARHGIATMDTLIAIGSLAAYGYSVWVALASTGGAGHGSEASYFDTGAVIVTLIVLGRWLEARARARASDAAKTLLNRGAKEATLLEDGQERSIPIQELRPGNIVVVRPGEKVPADGVVKEGTSWVDLSLLTGESVPVDVGPGDDVVGASINGHGRIVVFVTRTGSNSTLAAIVRLLEAAQGSKAPIERLADRVSAVFVPIVLVVAAATVIGWLAIKGASFETAVLYGVSVLVVACPCALGLATPAAIMAGTGRAAELGVLFKDAEVFETIHKANMVLLDKTGTVTEGEMTLVEIAVADRFTPEYVLGLAAAAELGSEHPIARAIVAGAHERDVSVPDASGHIVHPGAGAEALVGNHVVSIVRADDVPAELLAAREDWSRRGLTLSAVLRDGATIGLVAVADRPKPEARSTVSRIQGMGLEVGILTGDRKQTAEAIAESVGVRRVLAEVYPEGKVAEIQALKSGGRRVIFVGDGLNDAPALASADVGIALGSGTDVALAAADVNLLGEDLEGLADALELAHRTYRVIQENLFWAFAYNAMMIPAAVAGALDPMLAAAAMALSSITVVANALRLRGFQRGGSPGNTRAREGVDAQRAPSRAGPEGVSSIGTKDDRQWTR